MGADATGLGWGSVVTLGLALTLSMNGMTISFMRSVPSPLVPFLRAGPQLDLLVELLLHGGGNEPQPMSAVARAAGVALPTAHRELERLIEAGVLTDRRMGRQRLVAVNAESPFVEPLSQILEVAFGAQSVLARLLDSVVGIEAAVIYGSYAARAVGEPGPAPQDIDLLVIGDNVAIGSLYEVCRTAEERLRKPVNPTVLRPAEYADQDSGFIRQIRSRPMIVVVGRLPDGRAPGWQGRGRTLEDEV